MTWRRTQGQVTAERGGAFIRPVKLKLLPVATELLYYIFLCCYYETIIMDSGNHSASQSSNGSPASSRDLDRVFGSMILRGNYSIPPRASINDIRDSINGVKNPIFDYGLKDESLLHDKEGGGDVENCDELNQPESCYIWRPPLGPSAHGTMSPTFDEGRREEVLVHDKEEQDVDNGRHECVVEMEGETCPSQPRDRPREQGPTEQIRSPSTFRREEDHRSERNTTNMTSYDRKWLKIVENKFRKSLDSEGIITLDIFLRTLGLKKDFFNERLFQVLDIDGAGTISIRHLMKELKQLANSSPQETLYFLFKVYDKDGDGKLKKDEIRHVLETCIADSSLSLSDEQIEDLTDALFEEAEDTNTCTLTFDDFSKQLNRHPGIKENLSISVSHWLKQKDAPRKTWRCPRYFTSLYIRNHLRKIIYLALYTVVNVILFVTSVYKYRQYNTWLQIARGCGQCLNLNCMWILVLMLRNSITFLRSTKLRHILPLDQHILFHKITGYAIAIFSLGHAVAHIGNAAVSANATTVEMWEILFTTKAGMGHGILTGSAYFTGWLLAIILIPMIVCSMSFVRRSGHFQVFYTVHLLYIPFWILVLMHGSNFWKWFVVPGAIFIVEKISRSKVLKKAQYGDMWIEEVNLLPSKVTHLVINRPENFNYKPGDYVFLQIPVIAKYEWHPFTISSAPEMEGKIWLHVRSAGNWTNKLYEYFDKLENTSSKQVPDVADTNKSTFTKTFLGRSDTSTSKSKDTWVRPKTKHKVVNVKCFIDGPYGTCARELLKSEHAVLIGAGIGVTPMASILQSIWYKFQQAKLQCPSCYRVWYNEKRTDEMKLKKVDFIWVNRDQISFEWFLTLLNELEIEQTAYKGPLENAIQTHLYMTAAKKRTDLRGIGLQMALDLLHKKNQTDLITGLRAKTNPGRPDWDQIFKGIKTEQKGKVKVYFCGPPALGKTVKETAMKYDFDFSKESF